MTLSIEAMAAGGCTDVVVVSNPSTLKHFGSALTGSPVPVHTTLGGSTRQESVRRGLTFITGDPLLSRAKIVLIHDAVRPMTPAHVVEDVIRAVRQGADAVAPALLVTDSIRMIDGNGQTHIVDRSSLRAIQTPQGFPLDVIVAAHELGAGQMFTDDLSCAEAAGHHVHLVEGSRLAMKITEPTDLTVAKALWKVRSTIGHHSGKRIFRLGRRG